MIGSTTVSPLCAWPASFDWGALEPDTETEVDPAEPEVAEVAPVPDCDVEVVPPSTVAGLVADSELVEVSKAPSFVEAAHAAATAPNKAPSTMGE
jgi:hypothetical protein